MTNTFQQFKNDLGEKVRVAKATGMSGQAIAAHAEQIGDYLARNYDPQSPEQRLLKELWEVSDQREQQAIAEAVVKLVQH